MSESSNVLQLVHPKTGGLRPCARCNRPIARGDHYFMVREPSGTQVPVHMMCMGSTTTAGP